ncbi:MULTISPECIES: hypothetical protein [unclassified Herbaspirillum]|uniref:hypothetical protein n=1 Tax=unclassified Herbaspirillum TaxID=2624150 RepID=UPI00114EF45A|nr:MULTISPECIES: hypothetical protein [unclassified Herbaspirillum]MBB5390075.1 hypothetical protein [Herbaspirillum sp. SJZ102]
MKTQQIVLSMALSLAAAAVSAQPFSQPGPTGDNRAATGNPGTQEPPAGNGKKAAQQKKPMRGGAAAPGASKRAAPDSPAPVHSSGTPAENSSRPESAK